MKEFILSNAESRKVDNYTINNLGISGRSLMKAAGNFITLKAKMSLKNIPGSRIDIFCGVGNNGGDGLVAAVDLIEMGASVKVWIVGEKSKITGEPAWFLERCNSEYVPVNYLNSADDLKMLNNLHETELIIDALLGTGISGKVKGIMQEVIDKINTINHQVISVDIPSGINGTTGIVCGVAVKATKTVTMGFLKRGLLYNDGPKYSGQIILADINYPNESYSIIENKTWYYHKYDLQKVFPKIEPDTNKHRQGKVLVLAGSKGMSGAACLSSNAALRSGAGLVINAIPKSLNEIIETKLTEVMTLPVEESASQTFCPKSMGDIKYKLDWADVIVFGPGVSADESVIHFGRELIERTQKPIIIDADGLGIFYNNLDAIKNKPNLILTPHIGEFSKMTGIEVDKVREDRISAALDFVKKYGCKLLLKGAHSISINNDLTAIVNSTGNPGLATAGSGDILSGIIAGFVAQGIESYQATTAAMAVHGYSADLASMDLGIRGLIATDLLNYIPKVLKEFDQVDI